MTDYLRIMNLNIKNMKHIYFTHYRFYITQKHNDRQQACRSI